MPSDICQVWDCDTPVKPGLFACYEHFLEYEDEELDECPGCGLLKYVEYEACGDCDDLVGDDDDYQANDILDWEPDDDEDEEEDAPRRSARRS